MEDPSWYSASSSKNKLHESCARCFSKCPTCSTTLAKREFASSKSNKYETDSSDDDDSEDGSENFLSKWDGYLSTLSKDASSSSHKQAIFGLRYAIEEINITKRRSTNSSRREYKKKDPVSPRMSRILEFMSENDLSPLNSCSESKLGRLFEYLDIKAGNICRDPSVRPPGTSLEEEAVIPEVGINQAAIHPRCPICLEDLFSGHEQVKELQCEHRFHLKCIETHFGREREKWCPVCAYNARKEMIRSSTKFGVWRNWRRFWVCFRGPFSRIIARSSPSSSPSENNSPEQND